MQPPSTTPSEEEPSAPDNEIVAVDEPKEIVPKVPTLPVIEITPKDVDELNSSLLAPFLIKGGCIYYVFVKQDLKRMDSTITPMIGLMLLSIKTAIQTKIMLSGNKPRNEHLQLVWRHVHEQLHAPLGKFKQNYTDFIPEYIEFRVTLDDNDDLRIHHTVRDKNGVPLGNR